MTFVRHEARLNRRTDDGATERDHLTVLAQRGHADAIRDLRAPEFPDHLGHLYLWAHALHGRSGIGMSGVDPLTWQTLDCWSRLNGIVPEAGEVDVLFALDAILAHPEAGAEKAEESPSSQAARPWPAKRGEVVS